MFKASSRIFSSVRAVSFRSKCLKISNIIPRSVYSSTLIIPTRGLCVGQNLLGKSKAENHFSAVLDGEIKVEKENFISSSPPKGFTVTHRDGVNITITKTFEDSVAVEVFLNLAGSVGGDIQDDEPGLDSNNVNEEGHELRSKPEMLIKLIKPSGRFVQFACSLPDSNIPVKDGEDPSAPTFGIDSVEVSNLDGYFVYSDLFDDNVFEQLMHMLLERDLNSQFQEELQAFCTSEEHSLYLTFLAELNEYCKE